MQDEAMFLTVIQLWAAAAWADGKLASNERLLLEHLIDSADIGDEARSQAWSFLEQKVALESIDVRNLDADQRQGVYRAACRMTIVDRHVDEAERVFLRQLRSLLDIEPEVATQIEQMFGSLPRRG